MKSCNSLDSEVDSLSTLTLLSSSFENEIERRGSTYFLVLRFYLGGPSTAKIWSCENVVHVSHYISVICFELKIIMACLVVI